MSEPEKYTANVLGKSHARVVTVTLDSGAEISVHRHKTKKHGSAEFGHKFRSHGSTEKDTVLEFGLTREACIALIHLYDRLDVYDDNGETE